MCKPCVNWKFETAETWGLRFDNAEGMLRANAFKIQYNLEIFQFNMFKQKQKLIAGVKLKPFKPILTYAAVWEPTNGFIHFDSVFPHIAYGFRNRTIPIAIYNVSDDFLNVILSY